MLYQLHCLTSQASRKGFAKAPGLTSADRRYSWPEDATRLPPPSKTAAGSCRLETNVLSVRPYRRRGGRRRPASAPIERHPSAVQGIRIERSAIPQASFPSRTPAEMACEGKDGNQGHDGETVHRRRQQDTSDDSRCTAFSTPQEPTAANNRAACKLAQTSSVSDGSEGATGNGRAEDPTETRDAPPMGSEGTPRNDTSTERNSSAPTTPGLLRQVSPRRPRRSGGDHARDEESSPGGPKKAVTFCYVLEVYLIPKAREFTER